MVETGHFIPYNLRVKGKKEASQAAMNSVYYPYNTFIPLSNEERRIPRSNGGLLLVVTGGV